jgi:flagellar protein FlbD
MHADVKGGPKDGSALTDAGRRHRASQHLPGMDTVILLTRLNGPAFALNPDLIERADATPDTVITLVDGTKYVVAEPLTELVALIRQYRASVVADAQHLVAVPADGRRDIDAEGVTGGDGTDASANVVQLHRRER